MPYDARMVCLPSARGSITNPSLGANCTTFPNVLPRPGKPSSPGNKMPAGAWVNTLLLRPCSNHVVSKWLRIFCFDVDGRNGSHLTPALMLNFRPTLHES